jgi:virginiamycin B lyase
MPRPLLSSTLAHGIGMITLRLSTRLAVALAVTACAGTGSAPRTTPAPERPPSSAGPTVEGTASPSVAPSPSPPPLQALLDDWRLVREGSDGIGLVVDGVLLANNFEDATVTRFDPDTLEPLEPFTFGTRPGTFPPDAQTIAPGRGGVWVTLASQHAVVLIDPTSGTVLRTIELDGYPYTLVEDGNDLWVADYERSRVSRIDLTTGMVAAKIPVLHPTAIAVGGGSVWAALHVGRAAEHEPIEGNGGQVARIDPTTHDVTLIDVGPRPYFLAVGFGSVWTGNATGASVSRVDMATNESTTIPIFQDGAFDIEVVGDSVWVAVGPQWSSPACQPDDPTSSFFARIDPSSNAVERVAFPCPDGFALDGDRVWVSGHDANGPITWLLEPAQ